MIVVTGATGHIGNVLVRQLIEQGKKVRALIWRGEDTTPLDRLDVELIEGDVLDPESLRHAFAGAETAYHLAGMISILPGKQPLVWRVNVEGTENVLAAACQAGVRRLVYTSSIHAIQRAPHGTVIDESLPYDPGNHYGEYDRSKAAASLKVLEAARSGLNAVIACPSGVIGPYDFRGSEMGAVIQEAAERRPQLYVDGAYDFVDVRDVANGLILAEEKGLAGESYILSGSKISVRYLLETVREATGRAFTSIRMPFDLARFAARFTPFYYRIMQVKPRFTSYSLEVLRSNSEISHAKATRTLGYKPRPLFESIADSASWYLQQRLIT